MKLDLDYGPDFDLTNVGACPRCFAWVRNVDDHLRRVHMPKLTEPDAVARVLEELKHAKTIHEPMNSAHEGYAVLLEELEELWDEIKIKIRDPKKIRKEAIQVGAMALRFLTDLDLDEGTCEVKVTSIPGDPYDECGF